MHFPRSSGVKPIRDIYVSRLYHGGVRSLSRVCFVFRRASYRCAQAISERIQIRASITHWIEYVCHGIIWRDFLCLWDHIIPDQWDDPSSRGNRQNFKLLRFRIGEVGMTLPKICVFDRISWRFRLRVIPSVKSEEQSLGSITECNYGIFVPCGFTRDRIYSFRKLQRNKFFWSIFRWIRRPFSAWYLMESLTGAVGWNSSENCIVRTVSRNLSESSPQQLSCWFFEY